MTNIQKTFEIEVWYRFLINQCLEKDYQIHIIKAANLQEAVNKASDLYRSHKTIPFQFLYKGEKQKPTIITKEEIFNLTSPIL